eukprot:COSAG01_NODE_11416_length_1939_cov_2.758152_1_plen_80_part_00
MTLQERSEKFGSDSKPVLTHVKMGASVNQELWGQLKEACVGFNTSYLHFFELLTACDTGIPVSQAGVVRVSRISRILTK